MDTKKRRSRLEILKPVNGWRDFFGEVGIIVLGVIIALGLEQLLVQWNWSQKVQHSRIALREELTYDYLLAEERVMAKPCLMAQLDALEKAVVKSRGAMAPVPLIVEPDFIFAYRAPWQPWHVSAWQTAVSDEVLSHFPRGEREGYETVHAQIAILSRLNEEESAGQAKLLSLTKPLEVDAATREHFVELIEGEREKAEVMAVLAKAVMKQAAALRALPSAAERRKFEDRDSVTIKYCREHRLPLASV